MRCRAGERVVGEGEGREDKGAYQYPIEMLSSLQQSHDRTLLEVVMTGRVVKRVSSWEKGDGGGDGED